MSLFSREQILAVQAKRELQNVMGEYLKQMKALDQERKRVFEDAVRAMEEKRMEAIKTKLWERHSPTN
jgi:transcriptional regulator of NAD metabolism